MSTDESGDIDRTCRALKIIGQIRENQRLLTNNDDIYVSNPSAWQWALRLWNRETRQKNLQAVEKIFQRAFHLIETCLQREERYRSLTKQQTTRESLESRMANAQLIDRMQRDLDEASHGITRWAKTYADDGGITGQIKLLCNKIEERRVRIQECIKYMDVEIGNALDQRILSTEHAHEQEQGSAPHSRNKTEFDKVVTDLWKQKQASTVDNDMQVLQPEQPSAPPTESCTNKTFDDGEDMCDVSSLF